MKSAARSVGCFALAASDMLTHLEANLHPEAVHPANASAAAKTISGALAQDHELRAQSFGDQQVALVWLYDPATGNFWHNSATGGYSAYAFVNPATPPMSW
jgi:serine-type D-Ala-D-Ala carboxypeptidase/endopeptidase